MEIIRKNGKRWVLELDMDVTLPVTPPVTGVEYDFGTFAIPNNATGYNLGTFTNPTSVVLNMGKF